MTTTFKSVFVMLYIESEKDSGSRSGDGTLSFIRARSLNVSHFQRMISQSGAPLSVTKCSFSLIGEKAAPKNSIALISWSTSASKSGIILFFLRLS